MEAQEGSYFDDIKQGFELLVQGNLSYIKLEKNLNSFGLQVMAGRGIKSHSVMPGSWTLSVTISTSLAEVLRGNSFDLYKELNIGQRYQPVQVEQNQNMQEAKWEINVKYIINDIDEFIIDLQQSAWEVYNRQMTTAIDGVLDAEDR